MGFGNNIGHDLLVANLKPGVYDSKGNKEKDRTGFKNHLLVDCQNRWYHTTFEGTPSESTGVVTIDDNDFTIPSTLILGDFDIKSGRDWTPGGDANLSAIELAAAINNLPGYQASPVLNTVEIEGKKGIAGAVLFETINGGVVNFTLSPEQGRLNFGSPTIGGISSIP